MPYSSISEVPKQLRTAGLSLRQANEWAEIYDALRREGQVSSPAAVAWATFKKKYKKVGPKRWVLRKKKANTELPTTLKGYELFYRESPEAKLLEDFNGEGKVYEKELIREGEWVHPQKPAMRFKVDFKRMQEWVNNFKKDLFKVHVPKRHSLDPEDNRGWVRDIFIKKKDGKNILFGHLDITNDKMQKLIDNGDVQDVSISVGSYTDNQGVKHGETLQHVALTVIPHIDGQSGFKAINAEGYICLEEVNQMDNVDTLNYNDDIVELSGIEKPVDGSKEQEFMKLHDAIEQSRIFSEPDKFEIVATFSDRVIVKYYGSGEGVDGLPTIDRYFNIPYAFGGLDKHYEFGNKQEVEKQIVFIPKVQDIQEYSKMETEEVKDMDDKKQELESKQEEEKEEKVETEETKQEEKKEEQVETEKEEKEEKKEDESIDLEKISAENEQLKKSNSDLESKIVDLEKQIKDYQDKERIAFEVTVDKKVDGYVKAGKISPAEQDAMKAVFLKNDDSAKVLEAILEGRQVISFEDETEQKSDKPQDGGQKTESEVNRIMDLGKK